jgi:hypothetical protein
MLENFILFFGTILALSVESFVLPKIQIEARVHKARYFRSYSETPSSIPNDIERVLSKEYATFFSPMFKSYYSNNVEFIDPLNTLVGIDKYQNNVDMLAGRNSFGSFLFKDASISLHNVKRLSNNQLQTRWTLQVTVKSIPWQPRPRFSGVSIYTLNEEGIIIRQEDYWDSINLINGKYSKVSITEAIGDFLGQLQKETGAEMSAPELPVYNRVFHIEYRKTKHNLLLASMNY